MPESCFLLLEYLEPYKYANSIHERISDTIDYAPVNRNKILLTFTFPIEKHAQSDTWIVRHGVLHGEELTLQTICTSIISTGEMEGVLLCV